MAFCSVCGDEYSDKRLAIGYRTCLAHGEAKKKYCVLPVPKSNGVVGTLEELKGIGSSHKTGGYCG